MVENSGQRGDESIWNLYRNHIHHLQAGDGSVVCDLRPIFELYSWEIGFDGGGSRRKMWWHKEVTDELLRENLAQASQEVQIIQRMRDTFKDQQ